MAVTVNINGLSSLHQTSGGIATATLPDVCKTPPYSTPVPYPNIALSSDLVGGTVTVTLDGSPAAIQSSMFVKSSGDEAGALGGVVSQVFMMEATFLSFSPTVFFDGQPACRLTDKMLMNKANTVCMDGAQNPPVIAPDVAPPGSVPVSEPEQPTFCHITSMQVSCGHDKRVVVDAMKKEYPVLQVISAADKPDTIIVDVQGTCGVGNPACPALFASLQPNGEWKSVTVPQGTFEVPAPYSFAKGTIENGKPPPLDTALTTIGQVIERLMGNKQLTRDRYVLHPLICNKHPDTDVSVGIWTHVEVFLPASISGEVTLGYAHPKLMEQGPLREGENQRRLFYDRLATWTLTGSIEAKWGDLTLKLEKSGDMKDSDPLPLFGGLLDMVGSTVYMFDSMKSVGAPFTGDILFPKWKFSAGSLALAELPNSPLVGPIGKFSMGFDPLIGLQLKVSILDWIIVFAGSLAPGPGNALAKALLYIKDKLKPDPDEEKERAKKATVSADIDIELVTKGVINGGMGVVFTDGKGELDGDATHIEGVISVQIEGRITGHGKLWRVEISGGGKIGLAAAEGEGSKPCEFKAGVSATMKSGRLIPDGDLSFSGMAFYYLLYVELGVGGAESEKKAGAKDGDEPGKKTKEPTRLARKEKKGSCVLIKPWKWNYRTSHPA
jgi:hypothetical protein